MPVVVGEGGERRLGDRADPELEGGAVVHQVGDVAADRLLDLGELLGGLLVDRVVDLDQVVDLLDVDERVAVGPRHPRVDLGDDRPRDLDRRVGHVDRDAQRAVAVLVRGRDVDEGDVDGEQAGAEERRHLGEEDREVVGPTLLHRLARVLSHEEGVDAEAPLHARGGVRRLPLGVERHDLDHRQLGGPGGHRLDEPSGRGRDALDEDAVARLDDADGLLGGDVSDHALDGSSWRVKAT
jgi:hypothetical protein